MLPNGVLVKATLLKFLVGIGESSHCLTIGLLHVLKFSLDLFGVNQVNIGRFERSLELFVPQALSSVGLSNFNYFSFKFFIGHVRDLLGNQVLELEGFLLAEFAT